MSTASEIEQAINGRRLYYVGDKFPNNWFEAFQYWLPIAEAGDPKAQYNVGRCYDRGEGIDRNYALARLWYEKAAAQDEPRAHFNLHLSFLDEDFGPVDDSKAEAHLQKALAFEEPRALLEIGKRALREGRKGDAEKYSRQAYSSGLDSAWQALAATQIDISCELSNEKGFYQSFRGPTIVNGTSWDSGGSETHSYDIPVIVISIVNNSKWPIQPWIDIDVIDPKTGAVVEVNGIKFGKSIPPGLTGKGAYRYGNEQDRRHVIERICVVQGEGRFQFRIPPLVAHEAKSGPCFVVTACMGDERHPVVMQYREFRDRRLINTRSGRALIAAYYWCGPKAARFISARPLLKQTVRRFLEILSRAL